MVVHVYGAGFDGNGFKSTLAKPRADPGFCFGIGRVSGDGFRPPAGSKGRAPVGV